MVTAQESPRLELAKRRLQIMRHCASASLTYGFNAAYGPRGTLAQAIAAFQEDLRLVLALPDDRHGA